MRVPCQLVMRRRSSCLVMGPTSTPAGVQEFMVRLTGERTHPPRNKTLPALSAIMCSGMIRCLCRPIPHRWLSSPDGVRKPESKS